VVRRHRHLCEGRRARTNAEVGDPANDALRVDAEDLRVKAIGEGANLGVTQAAASPSRRRAGGSTPTSSTIARASTARITRSISRSRSTARWPKAACPEDRDALLVRMTDNVSELVLEDNRLQALAMSIAEKGGSAAVPSLVRIMETFEASGRLDRKVEGLAANDELLRRAAEAAG
jgi:glutamate dehydrogenase